MKAFHVSMMVWGPDEATTQDAEAEARRAWFYQAPMGFNLREPLVKAIDIPPEKVPDKAAIIFGKKIDA